MGRAQKYANVLDDYDKKEEELSNTRSIKNKELYDTKTIDPEEFEKTAPISIDELKKLNEATNEAPIAEEPKVIEEPKVEEPKEDIYLTASLQPIKKKFRLKKVFKVLLVLLLLVGIGIALFFFLLKPAYDLYVNSKPINVFYNTIDGVSDYIIEQIDSEKSDTGIIYGDLDFQINTNIEDLDFFSNNRYGYSLGMDTKNDSFEEFMYIKDDGVKYGRYYYLKDGKSYNTFTNSGEIYDVTDYVEENSNRLLEIYKNFLSGLANSDDTANTKYFIDKNREIIKDLINKNMVKSSKDTIEVNGETIKVTKNTLSFDKEAIEDFEREFDKKYMEDEKLLSFLADLYGTTVDELKDEYEFTEYEDDYKLVINIYTVKGTQVVGLDVEENGFTDFYLYINDKDFEVHINLTEDEDKCSEKEDCAIQSQDIFDIKGEYDSKSDITEVTVNYNKEKLMVLEVKKFTKEKTEFNYEIYSEDEVYKGDFLLLRGDRSYNLDMSVKNNGEYLNINLNFNYSFDKKIADFDSSKVVNYTEAGWKNCVNDFGNTLEEKGLIEGYSGWAVVLSSIQSALVEEYDEVTESVSL